MWVKSLRLKKVSAGLALLLLQCVRGIGFGDYIIRAFLYRIEIFKRGFFREEKSKGGFEKSDGKKERKKKGVE